MSEAEIQDIFTKNLNSLLYDRGKTQLDLAKFLNVSNTSVNNWCKGYNMPRMDKVDKICEYFHINRSDLIEDHSSDNQYYTNKETARLAQEAFDDPDTRILLDAKRDLSPEDMQFVIDMVKRLKGGN